VGPYDWSKQVRRSPARDATHLVVSLILPEKEAILRNYLEQGPSSWIEQTETSYRM
jgi:hypothetical protein